MKTHNFPFPLLIVEGNYKERGLIHGESCREKIKENIALCKYLCTSMRKISDDTLMKEAKKFILPIKRFDRDLYYEMCGIAEGADVPIEEIIMLNARSELMNQLWGVSSLHEGCTTFSIMTNAQNNKLYLAQTWDWIKSSEKNIMLLCSKDGERIKHLSITEPGIIGNVGVNSKGIGVFLNYISILNSNQSGVPYHVILRRALESNSMIELQRNILRAPVAFAIHILAADFVNGASSYELTCSGIDFLQKKEGYILHTNHVLSDKLLIRGIPNKMYMDSIERYKTAQRRLDKLGENIIGVKEIYEVFAEHNAIEADICKHNKGENEFEMSTLFTCIFEMSDDGKNRLYVSSGSPCEAELSEIDLVSLWE